MANQWFRLYAEFATDPKVQMMSEAYQRRFLMVMCLRCSNGDVTLHDEEIAFQLRISNEDWQETKTVFVAKNLIDNCNDVVAWDKRQFLSDSSAVRVARHRERKKQKCNVTVTPPDTYTDTYTELKDIDTTYLVERKTRPRTETKPPGKLNGAECKDIFEYWQAAMHHPQASLDDKRKALIQRSLKSYGPVLVKQAILGCSKTPHNIGDNDRRQRYDGLHIILDPNNIDRFIANAGKSNDELKRKSDIDWHDQSWANGL